MKGNILSDSRGRCVGKDRSRSDDVTQVRHWSDQCCHVVFICRKSVVCSAAQCRIDDVLYPLQFLVKERSGRHGCFMAREVEWVKIKVTSREPTTCDTIVPQSQKWENSRSWSKKEEHLQSNIIVSLTWVNQWMHTQKAKGPEGPHCSTEQNTTEQSAARAPYI